MSFESVTQEAWRELFGLAAQVRAVEPWHWMEETDIFGVRTADGETLFVSVMGLLGEHHAVALYVGADNLAQFWQMQSKPDGEELADVMMATRQVQACFGKKSELMAEEKRLLAALGLTYKGSTGWTHFRSYEAGAFPWLVDAKEVGWLTAALGQLLEVAPRIQKDRRLLGTGGADRRYLMRVATVSGGGTEWRDAHEMVRPTERGVAFQVPDALMRGVQSLPIQDITVELDVFASFMRVGKRGERPRMPYLMLAVESESGFVLGVEMIDVQGSVEDLWVQAPVKCLGLLKAAGMRPRRLALRTAWLANVLQAPCKELGIERVPDFELAALSSARRELEKMSAR